jgi:hypothetical protein
MRAVPSDEVVSSLSLPGNAAENWVYACRDRPWAPDHGSLHPVPNWKTMQILACLVCSNDTCRTLRMRPSRWTEPSHNEPRRCDRDFKFGRALQAQSRRRDTGGACEQSSPIRTPSNWPQMALRPDEIEVLRTPQPQADNLLRQCSVT